MAIRQEHVRQHLELAAQAYGSDFVLPRGTALPRARSAAETTPPDPPRQRAAAPPPPAISGPASDPPAAHPVPPPPPRAAAQPLLDPTVRPERGAAPPAASEFAALRAEVLACRRCGLCEGRTQAVFGEGNPSAEVFFLGEAPGAQEDRTGRPFVGPAGQLLDRILRGAMGLRREDVYIANVAKCRPPNNRAPEASEVAACLPFLHRQIALVQPRVLVCLGRVAAQSLLGSHESAGALRGRSLDHHGIPVVVTWHPSYLLHLEPKAGPAGPARDRAEQAYLLAKSQTWTDIKRVNALLGRPETPAASGQNQS